MRENIIESVNTCTNIENLDENEHVFIYIMQEHKILSLKNYQVINSLCEENDDDESYDIPTFESDEELISEIKKDQSSIQNNIDQKKKRIEILIEKYNNMLKEKDTLDYYKSTFI